MTDPYRWLEADDDEVHEWVAAQNEYADGVLDTGTAERLRERFEAVARVTDYGPVTPAGGRYFQTVEGPAEDHGVLYVRESVDAEPRALVDPNGFDAEAASMNWFDVDPDGERVAYGYDEGGTEQYDVRVVDVDSGDVVDEVPDAGRVDPTGLAWADDGVYYVRTGGAGGESGADQLHRVLCYHAHGDDPSADRRITDAFGEHDWPQVERDRETGTLLAAVHEGTTHSRVYLVDEDATDPGSGDDPGTGPSDVPTSDDDDRDTDADDYDTDDDGVLVPLLTDVEASFRPHVNDGTVYVTTNYDAPFSRVLAVPVAEAAAGDPLDPDAMAEPVPETDAVLRGVAFAGDRLLAHHARDASAELSRWGDGERVETLPTPEVCSVTGLAGDESDAGDPDEAFFVAETFDAPPRVRRYDFADGRAETLARPDVDLEVDVAVSREFFESADGAEVPAFIVHREGLDPDGDAPTVLYGYGGFRIPQTPSFGRFRGPFLAAGGVFVVACLRGGTEYGEPWHEAGMRGNKQNVFDDFYAVAEGLVEAGYTNTDRLAAYGGSNGGLLAGAAVTQRPDLWGAVLSAVPLLDMLRFHEFLLGEYWTVEYGSPDDPDAFDYLRAYSPYHNVEERAYPPILFATAAGDTRVHPSHARKMTALLQERNTADTPVVLRTETDTGHGVGKPTEVVVRERAERWAWFCDRLGVSLE